MTGKTHIVGGVLFLLGGVPLVAPILGLDISPLELAIAAMFLGPIAGLLPDIDTPNSLISRGWIPFRRKLRLLSLVLGLLLSVPARIFGIAARAGGIEHRGPTHSFAFMMIWTIGALPFYMLFFALIAYLISLITTIMGISFNPGVVWQWQKDNFLSLMPNTMLYVFMGYLSHLVFDSFTKSGVPWLWWPGKKLMRFKDERGKWNTREKSYNLGIPKRLCIVTDSPPETPFRMACQLICIILVLINIALPVARRIDAGYNLQAAVMYSQAELEAGKGGRPG